MKLIESKNLLISYFQDPSEEFELVVWRTTPTSSTKHVMVFLESVHEPSSIAEVFKWLSLIGIGNLDRVFSTSSSKSVRPTVDKCAEAYDASLQSKETRRVIFFHLKQCDDHQFKLFLDASLPEQIIQILVSLDGISLTNGPNEALSVSLFEAGLTHKCEYPIYLFQVHIPNCQNHDPKIQEQILEKVKHGTYQLMNLLNGALKGQ